MSGFKAFILRGNLVELAVAFIIGASFATVVTTFTAVIMGFVSKIFGGSPNFDSIKIWKDEDGRRHPGRRLPDRPDRVRHPGRGRLLLRGDALHEGQGEVLPLPVEEPAGTPEDIALLTEIRDALVARDGSTGGTRRTRSTGPAPPRPPPPDRRDRRPRCRRDSRGPVSRGGAGRCGAARRRGSRPSTRAVAPLVGGGVGQHGAEDPVASPPAFRLGLRAARASRSTCAAQASGIGRPGLRSGEGRAGGVGRCGVGGSVTAGPGGSRRPRTRPARTSRGAASTRSPRRSGRS